MRGSSPVTLNVGATSVQQLSKEAIVWKCLKHRNLPPLYGVPVRVEIVGIECKYPCLMSQRMENGNVRVFVKDNPTFNRFEP